MRFKPSRLLLSAQLAAIVAWGLATSGLTPVTFAQAVPVTAPTSGNIPEPVYWKQDLFLVPYQWGSAADPAAAQAVWLFVSKDRGASWQKISEARPHVKAFNYCAEGDGEYWFAVRTLDRYGREWPAGPHQPELRVIVDKRLPQIDELRCSQLADGTIEIAWRCTDQNLDANTWAIEVQIDAAGTWQPVPGTSLVAIAPISGINVAAGGIHSGRLVWRPATGSRPVAIRATVLDRAGNSGTYQSEVVPAPSSIAATEQHPTSSDPSDSSPGNIFAAPPVPQTLPKSAGWMSSSAASVPNSQPTANQLWPADVTSHTPFRLSSVAASLPTDDVTVYGNPAGFSPTFAKNGDTDSKPDDAGIGARYAGPVVNTSPEPARTAQKTAAPSFAPLEPFRQASISRLPAPVDVEPPMPAAPSSGPTTAQHVPPSTPKLVGSRTFALEYDLEDDGRWGVSKVELWGTRDGGQTWRSFARDSDHRSPLVVTVDEEGLYGFRIVVESTASVAASPPRAGDAPELWVAVDLHRPVIELTSIERGEGNLADQLILRWHATDDNLDRRPIALFYSSRPSGPWSAIATNLEDTGEYSWRVERHVPGRFFVRAEARDVAGNLAAFQTREPIEFSPLIPGGRLLDANTVGPTAVGGDASYR